MFSLFVDQYWRVCHYYKLTNEVILCLFDYHYNLYMSVSKMVYHIKNTNQYKLQCSHYTFKIFYRCPHYSQDEHLHCSRCGLYLKNNIKLRKALNNNLHHITIYPYKRPCQTLTNHLHFYTIN
jgi:hypothetical protein